MKKSREKLIEARAYELWEQEGRPHGAHERHWYQAAQEVESAAARKPAAPKAKRPAAPKPKKSVSKPAGAEGSKTKAAKKASLPTN